MADFLKNLIQGLTYGAQGLPGMGKGLGAMQTAKANQKYDDYINQRTAELESIFNNQYNQNFLDTDEAKNVIRNILNQMKEASDNVKSSSKITGASAEKEVASKDKMNENFANTLTTLASMGTQRKDRIMGNYLNSKAGMDNLNLTKFGREAQAGNQMQKNSQDLMNSVLMLTTMGMGGGGTTTATNPINNGSFFNMQNFSNAINPTQQQPGYNLLNYWRDPSIQGYGTPNWMKNNTIPHVGW
jgi:hypothetical protein